MKSCHVREWDNGDMAPCNRPLPCALHGVKMSKDTTTKDTNPKDAIGAGKPPLSTLPANVLFEVAVALLEGACKYRRHNYRVAGVRASIYYDAALRHLMAWWEGEDTDPDSNVHHVTKAIAGLMVLRDAMMNDMVTDDRPPSSDVQGWMEKAQLMTNIILMRHPEPLPPYTIDDDGRGPSTSDSSS